MTLSDSALYRKILTVRRFEDTVLAEFSRGTFAGTTHTYLGQEANAVGVLSQIEPGDIVVSNHRCHGHFLAAGGDPAALFAELMGKPGGVCAGKGGSQHVHWGNFYSNGILGSTVPLAVGMALAEKQLGRTSVTVVFFGDGALGEGVVYEALNMASLWKAPVLFVLEDNGIAQTTPAAQAVAGSMAARFSAFGIPITELDSSDVLEILPLARRLIGEVRESQGPRALLLHTCRFGPHSKGDDTRPLEEIAQMKARRDPLAIQAARLSPVDKSAIDSEVDALIHSAFQQALQSESYPTPVK